MKTFRLLLFLFILFFSCKSSKITTSRGEIKVDDGKIDFTFLQLNDVYEIAPLEGGKVGGMARVANLRNKLLAENPNTFTFMAGDFLNPSLLGTLKVDGKSIKGRQMIEVMNALGVDLVTFGNHEFDLSKNELQQRLNESNFAWTSANVRQKFCGDTFPFFKERNGVKKFVTDTHIIEVKDADGTTVKIGFFGVLIPSNPVSYVAYTDIFEQSKRAYNELKNKVDLVFGLTHVEIEQDKKIAEMLPEVPLIMGGHEHNNMLVEVGETKITKADANAKTVYIHRIHYNKHRKQYRLSSELVPVNEGIGEDAKVKDLVNTWNKVLDAKVKEIVTDPYEVILVTKESLDGRDKPIRSRQTNLGKLITKAMSFGFKDEVDCALVNGGSIRIDDQLEGNITSVDIFRVLPFGGGILKVDLTGALLKEVLDYGESQVGEGAYLQRYNVNFEKEWMVQGKPIVPSKVYSVAFSDFLLKGYDIPFLKPDNKDIISINTPEKDDINSDIRNVVIQYLKNIN